jgi:hypothetical protein
MLRSLDREDPNFFKRDVPTPSPQHERKTSSANIVFDISIFQEMNCIALFLLSRTLPPFLANVALNDLKA